MDSKKNQPKKPKDVIECIIPFIDRKSLLLSISFRSLNLEMTEYKMKVESILKDELKEPLITGLCDMTMVNKYKNIYIFIYIIDPKISNRF